MEITLNRSCPKPLYLQLQEHIEEHILKGVYYKGYHLPPERVLAKELGVNRSTIIKAYDYLKAKGLVDSKSGKGTFVVYDHGKQSAEGLYEEVYWDQIIGQYSFQNTVDMMSEIMLAKNQKGRIQLSGGFPEKEAFPYQCLNQIGHTLMNKEPNLFFQTPVTGLRSLKEVIVEFAKKSGLHHKAQEVMVVSGAQQGLDLLIRTFLQAGDVVAMEEPGFFGAIQLFKKAGVRLIGIPMEEDGMNLSYLQHVLAHEPVRMVYTIPNFQNPTGISMSQEKKLGLLKLAKTYQVPIIEEDPYGLLYFDQYCKPLRAYDQENFVIYLSTFSKTIAPGLRIGFLLGDETMIRKVSLLKQFTDIHTNSLSQFLVEYFIKEGHFEAHLKRMRKAYENKMDLLVRGLAEVKKDLSFHRPKGGYYLWLKLSQDLSMGTFMRALQGEGVDVIPGEFFYIAPKTGMQYFRINFTASTVNDIREGARLITKVIKKMRSVEHEGGPIKGTRK